MIFYPDLLPSILPEMWHESLIQRDDWWELEVNNTFRFQRYVLAYREQQRLCENNHKLRKEIVSLSIPMLKSLQWLKLATGGPKNLAPQIVSGRNPNQQWARVRYNLGRHVLDERETSRWKTEVATQFTVLLNALADSGVHVRKLNLITISLGVYRRILRLRQEPHCAQLSALKSVFLDTSVISRHWHNTANGHCRVRTLSMLLEEAQNLQTLEMHGGWRDHPRPYFLQCFRPSLPQLTTLSISSMTATEEILIDTLMAYRASLARLDLLRFELADSNFGESMGSWPHFFHRVPETLPCLLEIRLRDLRYSVRVDLGAVCRPRLPPLYEEYVEFALTNS